MTGSELRALRLSRNWSQTDLADFLGDVSYGAVAKWEKNLSPVPSWAADKLLSTVTIELPLTELAELLHHATVQNQSFPEVLADCVREYIAARKAGKIIPLYASSDGSEPDGTARIADDPSP